MPDLPPPLPAFVSWPTFPFEGELRVKHLDDPVDEEPARHGEDPAECSACRARDTAYIWVSERWRVRALDHPTGLPMVLILESRSHLDLGDLPNMLAAELGVLTVRLERAIRSLDGVARVHVNRWGDGSAHLHMWFLARPHGRLQLRGTFLSLWDDILPRVPETQWRENLAMVAAWLAEFGGTALAEPPHIDWQAPGLLNLPPDPEAAGAAPTDTHDAAGAAQTDETASGAILAAATTDGVTTFAAAARDDGQPVGLTTAAFAATADLDDAEAWDDPDSADVLDRAERDAAADRAERGAADGDGPTDADVADDRDTAAGAGRRTDVSDSNRPANGRGRGGRGGRGKSFVADEPDSADAGESLIGKGGPAEPGGVPDAPPVGSTPERSGASVPTARKAEGQPASDGDWGPGGDTIASGLSAGR